MHNALPSTAQEAAEFEPALEPPRLPCLECQRTFGRVEHLTRHARSHTKERLLKCVHCRKGFYRIDALRRHEQIHDESKRSLRGKGVRACYPCAIARRKCSGGPVCSGCQQRSLDCRYPDTSKSSKANPTSRPHEAESSLHSSTEQIAANHHESPMSCSNASSAEIRPQPSASENDDHSMDSNRSAHLDSSPTRSGLDQPSPLDRALGQNLQGLSEPWFEGNLSSINWLPYDWNPDFQAGVNAVASPQNHSPQSSRTHQVGEMDFENTVDNTFSNYHRSPQELAHNSQSHIRSDVGDGRSTSSPGSLSTQSAGHYYVNGDGARLPRVKRTPYQFGDSHVPLDATETQDPRSTFSFPGMDESTASKMGTSNANPLPLSTYNEISRAFELTCITSALYPTFSSISFPSTEILSHFIHLYIENFQSVLPFVHPITLDVSKCQWLFVLALAAAGSHFADVQDPGLYAVPMHEFLRRAIQIVAENGYDRLESLLLTQIKLLNSTGNVLVRSQKTSPGKLGMEKKAFEGLDIASGLHVGIPFPNAAFTFPRRCDSRNTMPRGSPSLQSTLQRIYVEKNIPSSTGEFSRILCVHALFRRTWEVENYFSQPLTLWDPTAERQDMRTIEDSGPVWLPDIPTYTKWRNSACDCLDILHWHANSIIGAASGIEHPTVIHLHLARVILLTPFRKIVELAHLMAGESTTSDGNRISTLTKHIQRWATEDQYKARLAMIHAGVLLWHVRRYSIDAFYEPSSVFLATLALWAYGRFAAHTSGLNNNRDKDGESPTNHDEDAESLFPTSMQLDRPADDELVQLFVKRGTTMRANIMGVGNLCSPKGHVRVLVEGRRLLRGLKKWGTLRGAMRTLEMLAEGRVENTLQEQNYLPLESETLRKDAKRD
ncbi:hypothetical protein G7Y89_g196 [Cudoniella acicularis]|uniref:C2H2-type domain-containing protein n=1 Tax=Cudoniella acicularis TaxID=354080 RepID=A0A8H4W947_9HELO|nr:hypothetical protein G7Y89_g196 [Cudoniella acicularis]